jgi:hypothetical protein
MKTLQKGSNTRFSPSAFLLINALSKVFKSNVSHDLTNDLSLLAPPRQVQVAQSNRKLIIDDKNARGYIATMTKQFREQTAMKKHPHPTYSPDFASSNFYAFGHVKYLFVGQEFPDEPTHVGAGNAVLPRLDGETSSMYQRRWRMGRISYVFMSKQLHDMRPFLNCSPRPIYPVFPLFCKIR